MPKIKTFVALSPEELGESLDFWFNREKIDDCDISFACSSQPDGINAYVAIVKYNYRE